MARAPSRLPRLPVPGQDHHCHPATPGGGQAAHHEGEVVAGQWVSRGGKQRGQRPGHPEDRGHLHRPSRRAAPVCAGGCGRVCVQAPQDRRARAGKPPRTGAGMGKGQNRSGATLASHSLGARCTVASDPTSPPVAHSAAHSSGSPTSPTLHALPSRWLRARPCPSSPAGPRASLWSGLPASSLPPHQLLSIL